MTELISTLPEATLSGGMYIAFEAIDPATGAAVAGVKVSSVAVLAELLPGGSLARVALDDSEPQWQPVALEAQE